MFNALMRPDENDDVARERLLIRFERQKRPNTLLLRVTLVCPGVEEFDDEPAIIKFKHVAEFETAVTKCADLQQELIGHMLLFIRAIQVQANAYG